MKNREIQLVFLEGCSLRDFELSQKVRMMKKQRMFRDCVMTFMKTFKIKENFPCSKFANLARLTTC